MFSNIISTLALLQLLNVAPILLTRYHVAAPTTEIKTVTTGTTTVWLPPVGIYISDGQTSTSTITDAQWNTYPVTFTSIINKDQAAPTQQTTEAQQQQPTTTTTSSTSPAQPTTTETQQQQQQQQQPTTTEQAQPTTTEQQPQQPTTTEQQQQQQPTTTEQAQPTTTSTEQAPQSTEQGQQQGQPTTTEQTSQTTEQGQQTTEQNDTTTQSPSTTTIDYTSSTSSTSTSSPNPSSSIGSSGDIPAPTAIVYSPYANDRSCKSADTIRSDIQLINSKGIKQIRSYGTDCGSLTTVLETCRELGITVNQGVWISAAGVDSIDDQVSDVIKYGQSNGWDVFNLLTIGNEAIIAGYVSPSELVSKIKSVKSQLQSAGYNGKVTTSEPPATYLKYPSFCTDADIDVVGINPHSYFNANIEPKDAGSYIVHQQQQVAEICGGKSVLITETGYPSKGSTLGVNVPSPENQEIAISSIIKETGGDCTILTTYNDFWKDPGPYGIEQYFGVIQLFQ